MADEGKVIVLKLTIDNKDYEAKIDVSKGKLVDLAKIIDPLEQKFEQAYKKITAELSKYTSATESSIQTLSQWLSQQNLSLDSIERAIQKLQEETKAIDVNIAGWKDSMAMLENLRAAHSKLIVNYDQQDQMQKKIIPGQSQMNMAMSQFGFAVGDASMIFTNFRMALLGVGNNIPFIVQYFNEARKAAGGTATTMQLLQGAIAGGGGLIIGINALMLLMQVLPDLFDDTTEAADKQSDSIKKLREEYTKLTKEQIQNYLVELEKQIDVLEKKYPSTKTAGGSGGAGYGTGMTGFKISYKVEGEERFGSEYETYKEMNQRKEALQTSLRDLGNIENINNRIRLNQEQLNKLNENEASPFYYKNIVKTAGGLKEAQAIMRQWIEADEKLINDSKKKEKKDKFAENKAKAIEDLLAEELINQTKEEVLTADYVQLLEMKEAAEIKLKESKDKIRNADNEAALSAALVEESLTEKRIKLIEDAAEKYVDATEKEIEAVNKKKKADEDSAKQFKKWQEERAKIIADINVGRSDSDYEKRKRELDIEEALAVQKAQQYGVTEEQITAIHTYYSERRADIDKQQTANTLNQYANMLGQLAALFSKHTAAYKTLAVAQTWIEAYKQVMLASSGPPLGVGPILGPFYSGIILARAAVQTANIMKQNTNMPGYNEGGVLEAGNVGFFEGRKREIVAPEKDFITVANELVARGQIAINALYTGGSGGGSNELLKELRLLNENFDKYSQRPAKAYITQDEFNKGYNEADYEFRKSQ